MQNMGIHVSTARKIVRQMHNLLPYLALLPTTVMLS